MPTRLTLIDPARTLFFVDVPDGEFIMNCNGDFVDPTKVVSVRTVSVNREHLFTPFVRDALPKLLQTAEYWCYGVVGHEPVAAVEYPNPTLIYAPDPTGGQCICGVTCLGDNLSFVRIIQKETS
ncbi:hypothetical protein [Achromobacter phage Motura]|uniref:Uncharacterized protein n=1 Tax=Achromobacter phage Motura TaxID=2591403 RepID=A0A514CSF1_9CAUD|nr:hypothetical protein H1O15_gp055 [Achromobacter phage Motura]QDH83407.1 hypothetical protein [Achromobacter phage Motura]